MLYIGALEYIKIATSKLHKFKQQNIFLKNILKWTVIVRLTLSYYSKRTNKIYKFSIYTIQTKWKVKIWFSIPEYYIYWTSYNSLTSNTPQPATYICTTFNHHTPAMHLLPLSQHPHPAPTSPSHHHVHFFFQFTENIHRNCTNLHDVIQK